jgi:hypothetical protein
LSIDVDLRTIEGWDRLFEFSGNMDDSVGRDIAIRAALLYLLIFVYLIPYARNTKVSLVVFAVYLYDTARVDQGGKNSL